VRFFVLLLPGRKPLNSHTDTERDKESPPDPTKSPPAISGSLTYYNTFILFEGGVVPWYFGWKKGSQKRKHDANE